MSDIIVTLDLITKQTFENSSIEKIKKEIEKIANPIASNVIETLEITKRGNVEIYIEGLFCDFQSPEELIEFVTEIENLLGGFEDKSHVEWISQFPHNVKSWEKQGYEWSLILEEEDDYFDSEDDWEWEDE